MTTAGFLQVGYIAVRSTSGLLLAEDTFDSARRAPGVTGFPSVVYLAF